VTRQEARVLDAYVDETLQVPALRKHLAELAARKAALAARLASAAARAAA